MTLRDIKEMDRTMITPAIAAQVIGCNPQLLRLQARLEPEMLGFPVTVIGNRTLIPRMPFIRFLEGDGKGD